MHLLIFLLSICLLGGCGILQAGKLLAPESFGLTQIAPNIYVEANADEATRANLQDALQKAESVIRVAYGSVKSHPIVHACLSEACYESFGGKGSKAKVYGDRILLSPRGLDWHFLAHEWSHTEIYTRLSFSALWHLPQWFNEGVAVAVSEAPGHSEEHWQFLVASNIPRPTREELHSFKSLRQWLTAVHRFGETQNIERKAKGESEVAPVYTAAGHELRPWLANAGSQGLLAFLERLNGGQQFELAYQTMDVGVARDSSPPSP